MHRPLLRPIGVLDGLPASLYLTKPERPMQDPVILRGWIHDAQTGPTPTTLYAVAAGVQPGDWMIAVMVGGPDDQAWFPPDGGWTQIVAPRQMGTRSFEAWARQWLTGDPSTFAFTPESSSPVPTRGALAVLGNADGLASWVVGSVGVREETGTSTTNVAPALTTTTASMVITLSAEATIAADTIPPSVTAGDAVNWFWTDDASPAIETVFAASLQQVEAGLTSAVTISYGNPQTYNGLALQIAVPPIPVA
jgi:hypothetical protein